MPDTGATDYDHRRTAALTDPEAVHADMRARCPVAHSDLYGGFWVLTRYDDVHDANRDATTFGSAPGTTLPLVSDRPFIPTGYDPPEHQEYRQLLAPVLNPRRFARMEDDLRSYTAALLEALLANGDQADIVHDLVVPLTTYAISSLLGVPLDDQEQFNEWAVKLVKVTDAASGTALQRDIRAYYQRLVERRRAEPGDDLASHLLAATSSAGRRLSEEEIVDAYVMLTAAGGETTAAAGSHAFLLLDKDRGARRRLLEDAELIPSAVEEILRYSTPVYGFCRHVRDDVEVRGSTLTTGARVWLSWLSANFDEEVFAEAQRLDIERSPNRHLAFGAGIHRCPGAPLARLELRIMVEEVLAKLPDYSVIDPEAAVPEEGITRMIPSLPIRFGLAS